MSADQLEKGLLLLAAALLAVPALAYLLPRPRAALATYLFGIAFVPVWVGANLVNLLTVHIALAALCIASLLPAARRDDAPPAATAGPSFLHGLKAFDVVLATLALLAAGSFVIGLVDLGQVYLIAVWSLMYTVGRLAATRLDLAAITTPLVIMLAIVSVLALIEFVTGFNPWLRYTGNSTGAFRIWGAQQFRGSFVRAEGAFGHSIALGLCLAIGLALVAATRLRTWVQAALIAVMAAALVVTFSRSAFVSAGLGLVLVLLCTRRRVTRSVRWVLGVALVLAVPVAVLSTSGAFAENSEVSTDAALYRLWLWDLLPGLRAVGRSDLLYRGTDGSSSVGSFASIDNAVLLHALTNGWVPALILCAAFAVAALRLLLRGGDVALVAVVAQIPAFFTVALITQYAHLLWFVIGLAVTGLGAAENATSEGLTEAEQPESVGAVA
jgi:hypothetical protein